MLATQNVMSRKTNCDKKCLDILRKTRRNPPPSTKVEIHTGYCKAKYVCRKGTDIRACRNGQWIGSKALKCPAYCGKPADIPHATFSGSRFGVNNKLKYRCDQGYVLDGPKRRKCEKSGQWSQAPTCSPRTCGKPEDIPNAIVSGSSYNYMDTLNYSCSKGYQLDGPEARTCLHDGKWSSSPTCIQIRCRKPRRLVMRNGNVTTSDPEYLYGATLAFECNEGYELRGSDTMTCLRFGWSPRKPPYCAIKSCPDPGRPENGDRYYQDRYFRVGSTVRFSCQSGFQLSGSKERTCMENKEWNGTLTTCQDGNTNCPILGTPISGRKYGSGYNKGDIVSFECKQGFVLKGSAVRKCLDSGAWNGTDAICRDEFEDRFKGVNVTAYNLRKNLLDPLSEYTCNSDNSTGCNRTSIRGMDFRGRAINLNSRGGLDLVFVIDASSSVRKLTDFKNGLEFAKELVKTIGTSKRKDGMRVAAVTFGTDVKVEFNLGDAKVDTKDKAIKAIDEIIYIGGATASALALQEVRDVVVPLARPDSHRVLMFITDGMSNIGGPPKKLAKYLREEENFEIYAIGVGKKVRIRELMDIASPEAGDNHVIHVKDYDNLQKAIKRATYVKIDYTPCGESPVDLRARMVGGKNSKRGWWPWQIGLRRVNSKVELVLICGGALISRRWVLTAAHCFYHRDFRGARVLDNLSNKYRVTVGDHHLGRDEKSQIDVEVMKIFVHQDYDDGKITNDIALVKLDKEVELGPFVRTLCIPEKDKGDLAIVKKYGIATGWGVTQALKPLQVPKEHKRYSDRLQYSSFAIQSDQLCANKSAEYFFNSTVTFCAGDGKGGNDTCKGDSGGAFVREAKRGDDFRWVATGLISWGEGCAQKDKYGYYTRVYSFIDWIKKTMEDNS